MEPLPEAIAAMLRLQASIHQLLVEAFAERSKEKLLQAVLLEPTVDSYRNAVQMVDEMLELQQEVLPPLH
jgi:alpha-galactosidase